MLGRSLFAVLCSFLLCFASAQDAWLTIERYTDFFCTALDSVIGIDYGCSNTSPFDPLGSWTNIEDITSQGYSRLLIATGCQGGCAPFDPQFSSGCSPTYFPYASCEQYLGGSVIFRWSLKADPLPVPSSVGEYQYRSCSDPLSTTVGWGPFSSALTGYQRGTTQASRTLALTSNSDDLHCWPISFLRPSLLLCGVLSQGHLW